MKDFLNLLALPASLLVLLATSGTNAQEESEWRSTERLEHAAHLRRELEIQQRLVWQAPVGVKKMSVDEGEKFFLHYWDFGSVSVPTNTSALTPPILPHTNHERRSLRNLGRDLFARSFQCPSGTESCSSLGSDLCCPTDETCVSTSSGIGCCPSGETCGDTVGQCDTSAGFTSCPKSSGGGCCVPGATCESTGCVLFGTETVTATLPTSTVTAGVSFSTETGSGGTTTFAEPAPTSASVSGFTTTVTVTQVVSGQETTITSATTIVVGSTGSTSSSVTAVAPIRPTSVSSSATSLSVATVVTEPTSATTGDTTCPTGFYMCSAFFMGGCCRVGRNCDTTSCPSTDSTAVVTSEPTIIVPVTSVTTVGSGAVGVATADSQGSCANGWALCAASDGGGCCPSSYICGQSCTATVSGESNTLKEAPSSAEVVRWTFGFFVVAVSSCIGMVLL